MKAEILLELGKIEREQNIKILFAVESGSRAWGFASKDSDWDVRFVYSHNTDWYLGINDKKDTYDKILPNDIDLSGWDLKKALKLLQKSNPPLLEWLRSPIVYLRNDGFVEELKSLSQDYFNPKSCLYHYLHMAEGNYKDYLKGDIVKVKKYFYVMRPILACMWIEEKGTMPPMEFKVLVDELVSDIALKTEIETLLERKINGEELDFEPSNQILNDFLVEKLIHFKTHVAQYQMPSKTDSEQLNSFFRKTIKNIDA